MCWIVSSFARCGSFVWMFVSSCEKPELCERESTKKEWRQSKPSSSTARFAWLWLYRLRSSMFFADFFFSNSQNKHSIRFIYPNTTLIGYILWTNLDALVFRLIKLCETIDTISLRIPFVNDRPHIVLVVSFISHSWFNHIACFHQTNCIELWPAI